MSAIDRRLMLRGLVFGVATAGFGASILSSAAEAMPLALDKGLPAAADAATDGFVLQAQWRRRHRRRRRWVCWWHGRRRVCGWRYR